MGSSNQAIKHIQLHHLQTSNPKMLKLSLLFWLLLSSLDCKPFPQSQTVVDVVCPEAEDGFAIFVPHPTDCSLYYMCDEGSPVLMACHPGLYFDPSLNVCNYPEY